MKSPFSKIAVIKLPKHRQFNFTPRHFDEDKERLEKRKKVIAQEMGLSQDDERTNREINFRANLQDKGISGYRSKISFWSNIRLYIILGILLTICYFIFNNMDAMIESFTK